MVLISVCIPTYSRIEYLKETVASVFSQTYSNFELCIALDPKPTGPDTVIKNWCEQLSKTDHRVRFVVNGKNLGLAGNWNKVADMAKGEYLIILGDDDLLDKKYLETFVKPINEYKPDVCFSDQYFIDENGKINEELTEFNTDYYSRSILEQGLLPRPIETVLRNSVPMSSALIKRNSLEKNPFDIELNTPEIEVFLKIALNGGVFYYDPSKLAYYRVHPTSATSGGLRVHKLLKKIIEKEVPPEYESIKYDFISNQIVTGVNRLLNINDKKGAGFFLKSKYYPKNKKLHKTAQTVLLNTPFFIIKFINKVYSGLRK